MSDKANTPKNPGFRYNPPDNPGAFIGKTWRTRICTALTCLMNPRYTVPYYDADGNFVEFRDAVVKMTGMGSVIQMPGMIDPASGGGGGGFMGEYDQTIRYVAGETFVISGATTIAGIVVDAGYYGVPPAGTDSLSRVWAGEVPANPTGNAVPQAPLPTIGAAPNDKFYAMPIVIFC